MPNLVVVGMKLSLVMGLLSAVFILLFIHYYSHLVVSPEPTGKEPPEKSKLVLSQAWYQNLLELSSLLLVIHCIALAIFLYDLHVTTRRSEGLSWTTKLSRASCGVTLGLNLVLALFLLSYTQLYPTYVDRGWLHIYPSTYVTGGSYSLHGRIGRAFTALSSMAIAFNIATLTGFWWGSDPLEIKAGVDG
jgi:hypothetical protein